jgi:CHAT domain
MGALQARIAVFIDRNDPSEILDEAALAEAAQLWEAAQSEAGGGTPLDVFSVVAWLHWCRYVALPAGDDQDDYHRAIGLFAALFKVDPARVPEPLHTLLAADPSPADGPDQWARQAVALLKRAMAVDDPTALDQAIDLLRRTVAATRPDHPNRAGRLSNLGGALQIRFGGTGVPADLDEAIDSARKAAAATPPDDPNRAAILSNLNSALRAHFGRTGAVADLDEAIDWGRHAAVTSPANTPATGEKDEPDRRLRQAIDAIAFAQMVMSRLARGPVRDSATLGRVDYDIELLRQRVADSAGSRDRAVMLGALGCMLHTRFELAGERADLDEAVATLREALADTPADDPLRDGMLSTLGMALGTRFDKFGELADLNEAVMRARDAVVSAPADHPNRAVYLLGLGLALQTRFARIGRTADLDNAVTALRDAVAATPNGHPNRAHYLSRLGSALYRRFARIGEPADLDAAVTVLRSAVADTSVDDADWADRLSCLGLALIQVGGLAELDEAVTLLRGAVAATPAGQESLHEYFSELGLALYERFKRVGELADLNEAITTMRDALAVTPTRDQRRIAYLSNLGLALNSRFDQVGELTDLNEAVAVAQEAVASAAPDHPHRAAALSTLGFSLRTRFQQEGDNPDAEAAMHAWREAAASRSAPALKRLGAACAWGMFAASLGSWAAGADGYAVAVGLLPLLAWRGAAYDSRLRLLAEWASLAADATSCAIAAGQPERAVELLEHGRGVLWSQLLETRTDLTVLHEVAPELAIQLDEVRAALDPPRDILPPGAISEPGASTARVTDRQMALARRWDALVDQVRGLPEDRFKAFLRPPLAAELQHAAAGDGPVVVVNVGQWRCDALIVSEAGIRVIDLPALSQQTAIRRANNYLSALREFESGGRRERAITATLEWLWDSIAEPVLTGLGHDRTPAEGQSWPRLWWCPTGPLTSLPLHAAGYHDDDDDEQPSGSSVLDRVVSSYAPTLRTLIRANQARPTPPDRRLLMVALRHTPGMSELIQVDRERDILSRVTPTTGCALLEGPAATREAVKDALARHAWAHFSCHGGQDLANPSRGGLWLHDGTLTIADLAADRHHGELAFLSACQTATGGVRAPDEAITLAAALQYVGWRHVIATLWSVWDKAAADITECFYNHVVENGEPHPERAAEALHWAVRQQRQAAPDQPSRWAPFVHLGP